MAKNLFIPTVFVFLSLFFINATTKVPAPTNNVKIQNTEVLNRTNIEKQIGRKMNFKERIVWKIFKKRLKSENEGTESNSEITFWEIAGIVLKALISPFGFFAAAFAINRLASDNKKEAFKIISVGTLVILLSMLVAFLILGLAIHSCAADISKGCSAYTSQIR